MMEEMDISVFEETCKRAEELAGRPVEVEKLTDGRFIALWMSFSEPPPQPGATEFEALQNFIVMMEKRTPLPETPLPVPPEEDTI